MRKQEEKPGARPRRKNTQKTRQWHTAGNQSAGQKQDATGKHDIQKPQTAGSNSDPDKTLETESTADSTLPPGNTGADHFPSYQELNRDSGASEDSSGDTTITNPSSALEERTSAKTSVNVATVKATKEKQTDRVPDKTKITKTLSYREGRWLDQSNFGHSGATNPRDPAFFVDLVNKGKSAAGEKSAGEGK